MSKSRKKPGPYKPIPHGTKFGKWRIVGFAGRRGRQLLYNCRCECGRVFPVLVDNLRSGDSTGCKKCSRGRTSLVDFHENKLASLQGSDPD